jgi:hypothetical protein
MMSPKSARRLPPRATFGNMTRSRPGERRRAKSVSLLRVALAVRRGRWYVNDYARWPAVRGRFRAA